MALVRPERSSGRCAPPRGAALPFGFESIRRRDYVQHRNGRGISPQVIAAIAGSALSESASDSLGAGMDLRSLRTDKGCEPGEAGADIQHACLPGVRPSSAVTAQEVRQLTVPGSQSARVNRRLRAEPTSEVLGYAPADRRPGKRGARAGNVIRRVVDSSRLQDRPRAQNESVTFAVHKREINPNGSRRNRKVVLDGSVVVRTYFRRPARIGDPRASAGRGWRRAARRSPAHTFWCSAG